MNEFLSRYPDGVFEKVIAVHGFSFRESMQQFCARTGHVPDVWRECARVVHSKQQHEPLVQRGEWLLRPRREAREAVSSGKKFYVFYEDN